MNIEWWEATLVFFGGIITILTAWNLIESRVHKTKEPTALLESRVLEIERKMIKYEEMFGRDKARLDSFDESTRVILQALLAIMKHDIDGNNIDALKKASEDLQEYMIHKR